MSGIVVDLGSAEWGSEKSIEKLIERFKPDTVYAFDPAPAAPLRERYKLNGADVIFDRAAAWTHEGIVPWSGSGTTGNVLGYGLPDRPVECFDLAAWLDKLDPAEPVVLKLDVEGAEYELLAHLIETGAIRHVRLVLVEWHARQVEQELLDRLAVLSELVPVEEW